MKRIHGFIPLVIVLIIAAGCAPNPKVDVNLDKNDSEISFTTPGPNPQVGKPAESGRVAGLGTGLWHGLISLVTLIISFFNPDVQMYEVNNTGPLYNLGFLVGAIVLFAILGFSGGRGRRR